MDSTEAEVSESMNVDIVNSDEKQIELNELLGASDDEKQSDDDINKLLGNSDDEKHSDADINDLLGASDDEDEADNKVVGRKNVIKEEDATDVKVNYLDQILGRSTTASSETKARKCGNLSLPSTFQAEEFGDSFFFRTPNFIKVQPEPYDAASHNATAERERCGLTSTIVRWRNNVNDNGEPKRESNARLIKWNDGTFQLVVGDSVFDAKMVPTDNCYAFEQQKSIVAQDHDEFSSNNEERFREEACMECVGSIQNRVILQPTSISSDIHAKMSLKVSETYQKEQKIAIRDYEKILENPEKTLHNIAKKEEEQNRRERKARLQAEFRGVGGARSYYSNGGAEGGRRPGMNADYLNDDSQFEGDNLAQLKKGFKKKPLSREEEDQKRREARESRRYNEDDEEGDEGDEEDEDDEGDGEGEDGESLGDDDSEDEEEDEDEDEEDDEDIDEDDDEEDDEEGDSEEEEEEKPSKHSKKDKKKDKKHHKKDRRDREERKKQKRDKKRQRDEEEEDDEEDEGEDEEQEETVKKPSSSSNSSSSGAVKKAAIKTEVKEEGATASAVVEHSMIVDDDDDDEGEGREAVQQQKKRAKHTVIDSDED